MANQGSRVQGGSGAVIESNLIGALVLDVANSSITATYAGGAQTVSTGNLTEGTYVLFCDISGANNVRPGAGVGAPEIDLQVNGVSKSKLTQMAFWGAAPSQDDSGAFTGVLFGYASVPSGATHAATVLLSALSNSGTPTGYNCVTRAVGRLRAVRIA